METAQRTAQRARRERLAHNLSAIACHLEEMVDILQEVFEDSMEAAGNPVASTEANTAGKEASHEGQ